MYSTLKIGATALVTVGVLAVAAPALAAGRPDDRAGPRGVNSAVAPAPVRPDDRAGLRVVLATNPSLIRRPDGRAIYRSLTPLRPDDRAGSRGAGGEPRSIALTAKHPVAGTNNAFDWTAAYAGAATAIAVMIVLTTALALRRRHRAEVPA